MVELVIDDGGLGRQGGFDHGVTDEIGIGKGFGLTVLQFDEKLCSQSVHSAPPVVRSLGQPEAFWPDMPKAGIGCSQGTVFIPPRTEGQGGASSREYFGGSHDNAPLLQGKPTGSPMGHGLFRVLRSVLQDHTFCHSLLLSGQSRFPVNNRSEYTRFFRDCKQYFYLLFYSV